VTTNRVISVSGNRHATARTDRQEHTKRSGAPITVGVTGHRTLHDPALLRSSIDAALHRIGEAFDRSGAGHTADAPFVVVSALADGADRLVVSEVLARKDARLEVVLPLEPEAYGRDFDAGSQAEFDALLENRDVTVVPQCSGEPREAAYERAGKYVVNRSDVVIAIWDGKHRHKRGGTAETVKYARRRGVPLVWINAKSPADIRTFNLPRPRTHRDLTTVVDQFRDTRIRPRRLQHRVTEQRDRWLADDTWRFPGLPLRRHADWVIADFARADLLADKYQHFYEWASAVLFSLPVVAILFITITAVFGLSSTWVWVEVGALATLLIIWWWSRHAEYHRSWYTHRFLAEHLRSTYFLALVDERADCPTYDEATEAGTMIQAVTADLIETQPDSCLDSSEVPRLCEYLAEFWLQDQATYHWRTGRRYHRFHVGFRLATWLLFTVALGVAIAHVFERQLFSGFAVSHWLILGSILIPAVGAALHAMASQHEFHRHAERYERMAGHLRALHREMRATADLRSLQTTARRADRAIQHEASDWLGVVRFHDLELAT
jgi:hypothetical protein